jgi:DNA-binding beta-propeller fold protein YncE
MKFSFSLLIVTCCALLIWGCGSQRILPGMQSDGTTLLPNGWRLAPAGVHVNTGELPLNMAVTPDGRFTLTMNNGMRDQSITVVDNKAWRVVQTVPLRKGWVGLKFFDNGGKFAVSGGNDNRIFIYSFAADTARLIDSVVIAPPWPTAKIWCAGLDITPDGKDLYVCGKESDSLYVIDLEHLQLRKRIWLPAKPYTCLASTTHDTVFVSLWGGKAVAIINTRTRELQGNVPVGEHPCDLVESPDGNRLFVANANTNSVSVIYIPEGKPLETISTALFPDAPPGSTPNAVAIDPTGTKLAVANADNNYLALFDVSTHGHSRPMGFVPVGWYPTSVRFLGTSLLVASGKGLSSRANPQGPNPERRGVREDYIGSMFKGVLSRIDSGDAATRAGWTKTVYDCSQYAVARQHQRNWEEANALPHPGGSPSPISHVFYVIKENRTYDQVFGDMSEGNGDPNLCLFGEEVTPNHHALARQFVLLDNFYADAEVSADGHNWSMAAYANDYVEKTWPTMYGGRGGEYEYEQGNPLVRPPSGYLWDNCARHDVSYRSYGEFALEGGWPDDTTRAAIEGLQGHMAPDYRGWDLNYSDVQRAKDWERDFARYERDGQLPHFQIIKLPNDHTEGARRGSLSPKSYVAQNDLALGMIVDRISHSRYWTSSAIFVVEDDAQAGPDHVDAHRTVALVISPFTRHGFVDSELYSTSSMVRTMELILDLPPMSQFDAAATPMHQSFSTAADFSPYICRPARISLETKNLAGAYGQDESDRMDFSREDAAPDQLLSEIVWRSVKGTSMPPPVRSAFVRIVE